MKTSYDLAILKQSRENQIALLEKYGEKCHVIPSGFKNNLFWNAAHNLVTEQLLIYKLSDVPMRISDEIVNSYRKGTSVPEQNQLDLQQLISLLRESVDWLAEDLEKGIFTSYQSYPTSYGMTLNSVEEAIAFNNVHEGLHFGYMMALAKSL